ncbi:outer membrane protein [Afifella sp. IM 167]|uniref:outer membrane protein n=1 Tax=Afifella sp. IM 167 TaxID=2033586 RepID=UPI001CCD7E50|nr:outer membrane protein [Afifella sp. IM 167]
MRTILLSTAAFAMLGTAAMAADLPTYEPAPMSPVAAPTYNWTGGYVGAQGGYGWSDIGNAFDTAPFGAFTGQPDYSADGWLLGILAGYDYQWNWAVVGIRGDINWADITGNDGGFGGVTDSFEGNWLASVTARLGAGMDRFHPYVLGGFAYYDYDYKLATAGASVKRGGDAFGWTLGAGIEIAVTDNISVSGEYRHYWFNDENLTFPATGGIANQRINVDPDLDTFMVGVNWRFGGPAGPVMANY